MLKGIMWKRVGLFLSLILLWGLLAGCGFQKGSGPASQGTATRTLTDMAGRNVTVPKEINKVYCASPPGTLLLYTLAPEKMVGWNYELKPLEKKFILPSCRELPNLGGWFASNTGNPEEILKIQPDVVLSIWFGDLGVAPETETAGRLQEQLGLPVVVIDAGLTNLDKTYEFMGELLGVKERAQELALYCHQTIAGVQEKAKDIPPEKRVRVYYAEGADGLQTDPRGSQHSQVLDLVGGVNVAEVPQKSGAGMSPVSLEQVLNWNPDLIITWSDNQGGAYKIITTDPKWQEIKAVRNKEVYQIPHAPFNWFDRPPSVNRVLGLKWLANLLYPDLFPGDIRQEAREFYRKFYHYQLTEQEVNQLLVHSIRK